MQAAAPGQPRMCTFAARDVYFRRPRFVHLIYTTAGTLAVQIV